ncbi:MAG TPA: proline/glycine betaine ABC transporter ATP-binding protein [Acidimicrobiaceae bacterium]|nr:proline/glycine betaine ABC transporter ATP-binding protein [Acidimicrobiaceae bacterium]
MSQPVAIRLEQVCKRYPGAAGLAVDHLDLEIPTGEIVALVGPSGCGKTTTLKMINRLIEPTSGTIEIHGRPADELPVHELRRGIGYVIQQTGLFPHKTVAGNIATVPRLLGWDKARTKDRVEELVDLVGLERQMLDRYPSALSGGQQQRVGVARALAADPPILLMDEPYSAVDPIVRARLQDELLDLQRRVHKTIVLVTHDVDEALKLGDRVVILNVGGVLEQAATPAEILAHPASPFVADFLGEERGLKRLALLRVRDITPGTGPVAEVGDDADRVRALMQEHRVTWFGIREHGRLLGWQWGSALDGTVRADGAEPFRTVVSPDTTLRSALDGIVNSLTNVAVVIDHDGEYRGMVRIEEISEGVR